jgi:predicted Fe-Mo cluster-binding NifX family protein
MKIAVTAKGSGLGAWLDPNFENALQVVIVDENDRFTSFQPAFLPSVGKPGSVARKVVEEGVSVLVTGSISKEDRGILAKANISISLAESGSVLELVENARHL